MDLRTIPAPVDRPPRYHRGVNERDRLWTLVVQGHERLWRAGAYLFGKELVDRMVPPLLGARAKPRAKAKPTA